jgi:uncharacterized protein YbjT (DUF2867 family)
VKILLTGATGYIGKQLLYYLVDQEKHNIVALVRSSSRFSVPDHLKKHVEVVEADLLDFESLNALPKDIDIAYYLVHSMSGSSNGFRSLEERSATHFSKWVRTTTARQVIYLSGLANDQNLSEHLQSRLQVEKILEASGVPFTILRAGIIIGSGSASFEIIRDLVEKLPVMIAPKWVANRCQPIAIEDVVYYLSHVVDHPQCLNQVFEIGGPDLLNYKEMMERFAKVRGLKRWIFTVPVLTPKLSSYWLYFVTSTNFSLASSLVDSLKNEAICKDRRILKILPRKLLSYEEAIARSFHVIAQNAVISSWKDALISGVLQTELKEFIEVPKDGCVQEKLKHSISCRETVLERLWSIGGKQGWYYMNWAWKLRGFIDKIFGGVGLDRGRRHPTDIHEGDSLDFWRVLLADKENGHLLLYAEMLVPGEAWLEWKIKEDTLLQTATFRPKGVLGRLYWYLLYPFHHFIFKGMLKEIAK